MTSGVEGMKEIMNWRSAFNKYQKRRNLCFILSVLVIFMAIGLLTLSIVYKETNFSRFIEQYIVIIFFVSTILSLSIYTGWKFISGNQYLLKCPACEKIWDLRISKDFFDVKNCIDNRVCSNCDTSLSG